MSSNVPTARPLDLGGILDGAFSIYRGNVVALLGSVAVVVVPISLLEIVLGPLGFVVGVLVGVVTPAIGALVVGDVATGRVPSIGGVWRRLLPLVMPLILTSLLVILAEVFGLILLVIPGVLCYVWFSLSAQVLAIENRRYGGAMARSRQLVKGSWWRVFGILIVISLVTGFGSFIVSGVIQSLLGIAGVGHGLSLIPKAGQQPDYSSVSLVLSSAVGSVLVAPVTAVAIALLYFDLRLRKEGTDIAAAIDALE